MHTNDLLYVANTFGILNGCTTKLEDFHPLTVNL